MRNIGAYQGDFWFDGPAALLFMEPAGTPAYEGVNITGVSLFTTPSNGQCNSIGGGGIPI